jgi:Zn-dependent protease with chaperone function
MNDFPNVAPSWSGENVDLSLDVGLTALKRKDYQTAIAHLEAVCQAAADRQVLAKAQMGLVRAYDRTGNLEAAIALCQSLQSSSSQQVRDWATQTLEDFAHRHLNTEAVQAGTQTGTTAQISPILPDFSTDPDLHYTEIPQSAIQELSSSIEPSVDPENSFDRADQNAIAPSNLSNLSNLSQVTEPILSAQANSSEDELQESHPQLPEWKQAGRSQKWPPLGAIRLEQLGFLQAGTAIALIWLVHTVIWTTLTVINNRLAVTNWPIDLRSFAVFYHDPFWTILFTLVILLGLSPWLLDSVLQRLYGLQPLTPSRLQGHSPEANRLLKRVCNQRRIPIPKLGILPTAAPLALTYGCLPQSARIVISQGLLEQLNDDEIAAIYAGELAHIVYWDFVPMTLVTLIAQIPYLVYWQVARWGDLQSNSWLRSLTGVISAIGYGLYWLVRCTGLWLSRLRLYHSDRFASDVTGNPNGLTRALLKITLGTATAIRERGYTLPLLESFDLLVPVGHRTALSWGSVYLDRSTAACGWDRTNPGRGWLVINNAHPLMGDRLHLLTQYARHWRLDTEIPLEPVNSQSPQLARAVRRMQLQAAPFIGILVGLTMVLLLWTVGMVANWEHWSKLSWLQGDRSILWGLMLIGFSIGSLLRINPFFPDIQAGNLQIEPSLSDLLSNVASLPVDSQPVRLQGKLLGRRGIESWLVQDLILQTETGLIKLHYLSQLGTVGNLLLHPQRPDQMVNTSVTVTGWFRRGATPWIDVETIQPQQGKTFRSGHPIASTLLTLAVALWGAYIIARGSA